jgi:uncharacterized repeat protein (TIGR02543 family)
LPHGLFSQVKGHFGLCGFVVDLDADPECPVQLASFLFRCQFEDGGHFPSASQCLLDIASGEKRRPDEMLAWCALMRTLWSLCRWLWQSGFLSTVSHMTDCGKIGVAVPRVVSLMMVVSLVAGLTAFVASTASATGGAATPVATFVELQSEASSCTGVEGTPTRIALAANIPAAGDQLTVGCHVVLDLAGFALGVRNVVINGGQALTIDDTSGDETGSLTADASAEYFLAGIRNTGATLNVARGAVTAVGGTYGASIGGGDNGAGGTTVISGGTVTATAAEPTEICDELGGEQICFTLPTYGAGIGGGSRGAGGTTVISGGTVFATGGIYGAGVGGGFFGAGGRTEISGGTVTAVGGSYASAVGPGFEGGGFGSLLVSGGVLRLPSGELRIPDRDGVEVVVSGEGVIDGSAGDTKTYASIVGQGQIGNAGRILLPTANIGVAVFGRHFRVSFDRQDGGTSPDPVTVFADSFATGNRTFPANPTRDGYVFNGWNTKADGTGASITASTGLTALVPLTSTDGNPVGIAAYAQWGTPITACYPPNARVPAKARTPIPPPPCQATR